MGGERRWAKPHYGARSGNAKRASGDTSGWSANAGARLARPATDDIGPVDGEVIERTGYQAMSTSEQHINQPDGHHSEREQLPVGRATRLATADKLLLTPEEAARVLGIGRTKVFRLIREDKLESVQIDRSRRIPWEGLEEFVARLRNGHESETAI